MKTEAYLSPDRKFRYWLLRVWDESRPIGCSIGINPSTAAETENDATIRKDMGFMRGFGMGGLLKLNVSAYRSTDPREWNRAHCPCGVENTVSHLQEYMERFKPQLKIAAWGKNGVWTPIACETIGRTFTDLMCLGKNGDGTPRHTLRLPYSTPLEPFHYHDNVGAIECEPCIRWLGMHAGDSQLDLTEAT